MLAPFILIALFIIIGAVLIIIPSLTKIFPFDRVRNDLFMLYLRAVGIFYFMIAIFQTIRVSLIRYMMRINANFSRDVNDIRIIFFWQKRYWRFFKRYWSYIWVKLIFFLEIIDIAIAIYLTFNVVKIAKIVFSYSA